MKKNKLISILSFSFIGLLVVLGIFNNESIKKADAAVGGTIYSVSGYAWSDNIGWVDFNSSATNDGVTYDSSTGDFSGYAWSDNIGWVNFAPTSGYPSAPYHGAKVEADGSVTGWAKVLTGSSSEGWDGWISMSGSGYGPVLNKSTNKFSGYAWGSDVVGWLSFDNVFLTLPVTKLVAVNDTAYVNQNSYSNISVLSNDTVNSGTRVVSVSGASYGTVVNNSLSVRYVNTSYGTGTDSFTYTIQDSNGSRSTATVTVHIYKCGDGIVQLNEACDNGTSNGVCPATCSTSCTINSCSGGATGTTSTCGDGICSSDENFFTCPVDCASSFREF